MIQTLLFVTAVLPASCQRSGVAPPATYISRSEFLRTENTRESATPFRLVVSISTEGTLSLNNIETGTIGDTRQLSDSLNSIFEDRTKRGITAREVIVDPEPGISTYSLRRLLDCLEESDSKPIHILEE